MDSLAHSSYFLSSASDASAYIDTLLQDTYLFVMDIHHQPALVRDEALYNRAVKLVEAVQETLKARKERDDFIHHVIYAQCAMMDDAVLNSASSEDNYVWLRNPLQALFIGQMRAGEVMPERTRALRREAAPDPRLLVLYQRLYGMGYSQRWMEISPDHAFRENTAEHTESLNALVPAGEQPLSAALVVERHPTVRGRLPDDVMHPFICALVDHRPAPVRLPHRNLSVDRHPWLVPLNLTDAAHHALLVNSIRHALEEQHPDRLCNGGGRAVCGWLTSPYDTAVAVKQLGHTAIQRLVSGQQILLRYYDPAIHHILWAQLGNLQRDRWLGGFSGWHFLNGDGQLVSHCHTASPYPLMTFSLMLSPEDEDGIRQAGDIVRILESYPQLISMILRSGVTAMKR
ncbi:DotU family type IV/VI secretion system protein [Cronobacter sakazakii]|nr:DotU family type IV/VI secretion system protein [Cronobacter sakazakii]EKQ9991420.1 DotU family type IV/VI secretion system protein [Cronobacter sakazakii]EKR0073920.1 DotU family type IV/VI secretion system protein [Cronobacter sakazakii]EME1752990.1 DotU family type IV/VI secretion system protein [Cronobacter sakazakii]